MYCYQIYFKHRLAKCFILYKICYTYYTTISGLERFKIYQQSWKMLFDRQF